MGSQYEVITYNNFKQFTSLFDIIDKKVKDNINNAIKEIKEKNDIISSYCKINGVGNAKFHFITFDRINRNIQVGYYRKYQININNYDVKLCYEAWKSRADAKINGDDLETRDKGVPLTLKKIAILLKFASGYSKIKENKKEIYNNIAVLANSYPNAEISCVERYNGNKVWHFIDRSGYNDEHIYIDVIKGTQVTKITNYER